MKKSIKIFLAAALISALALFSACGDKEKLTDETIAGLIDLDLQITKFLYCEPPACDYSDSAELGGTTYYRITDEKFDSQSEWEDFIKSAYCGELAETALSAGTVVCIDGKTYSDGGGRGYDLSDNYTFEILSSGADSATVAVQNPSADPDDGYSKKTEYALRLTADGWRIEEKRPI